MPLPPALAARLAKRGILQTEEKKVTTKAASAAGEEEVFAEDYDDPMPPPSYEQVMLQAQALLDEEEEEEDVMVMELIFDTPACPNVSNRYHTCTDYCRDHWGFKVFEPLKALEKKHERLLRRYPVPEGWFEVGDPSTGRYYYWHPDTDHVAWLPPTHPRSTVSLPANVIQASLPSTDVTTAVAAAVEQLATPAATPAEEAGAAATVPLVVEEPDFEEMERELLKDKEKKRSERKRERSSSSRRDRDREARRDSRRERSKRARERDELDPMDPAAYSDISRGGWTAGLDIPGAAKSGVDSTASGPLFQQRPYPSPGAVLRANKEYAGKKGEEDEEEED